MNPIRPAAPCPRIAKATARNMKQNIFIAVVTPLLVLLTSLIFSDWMNMSIGIHEGSIQRLSKWRGFSDTAFRRYA